MGCEAGLAGVAFQSYLFSPMSFVLLKKKKKKKVGNLFHRSPEYWKEIQNYKVCSVLCTLGSGAVRFGHFIAGFEANPSMGVVLSAFACFPCEFPNLSNRRISTGIFSGSGRTMLLIQGNSSQNSLTGYIKQINHRVSVIPSAL